MSAAVLASTLTNNFSELLHAKPTLNPCWFQSHLPLGITGMDLGNASESAHHSESSGADAGRQRVLAGDAGICTTWNFAALFREDTPPDVEDTPPDVMESLIKELPRLIPLQNQVALWYVGTGTTAARLWHRRSQRAES
jgi:hypothetical protein